MLNPMDPVTAEIQLRNTFRKLDLGDVNIHLFRGDNLVQLGIAANNPAAAIREAVGDPVLADLVLAEVNRVAALPSRDTIRKSFEVGLKDASRLGHLTTLFDLFAVLTDNHPKAQDLTWEFFRVDNGSPKSSSQAFEIRLPDILGAAQAEKLPPTPSQAEILKVSEPFRIVTADFAALGEPVSASRLHFLARVIPALADKPEATRQTLLAKIIAGEYPFAEYNREGWISEIRSAD